MAVVPQIILALLSYFEYRLS